MSFWVAALTAGLSGFIALSYEIVWYRVFGFTSLTAPSTFGHLLGAYLLGVALGSLISRRFCRDDVEHGDPSQLRAVAVFVFLANLASFFVVPLLAHLVTRMSWHGCLPLVGLGAGLLGATLPLVAHFGIAPDEKAGTRLSYIYLANIIGSASGSLLTGFVFLDVASLPQLTAGLAACGVALALGLFVVTRPSRALAASAIVASLATVALLFATRGSLFHHLYERLYFKKKYSADTEFAETIENRHGVINVYNGMVYGGGVYDGIFNTGLVPDPNWVFRAYAIAAMHPRPARVLMIGLASGSWANIVASMPGLERLTVVEINPGYLQLIAAHDEVKPVLTDPKVEIVIDDGRRYLRRHPEEKFDVIVMNTTWHWRAHATGLLSREFLEALRSHLRPGGIIHYNSTMSKDVMKTAITVFPHALRIYNFLTVSDAPVSLERERFREVLLSWRMGNEPVLNLEWPSHRRRLDELLSLPDTINGPYREESLESREAMLARLGSAKVVTDDNMWCEWFTDQMPDE